MYYHIKEYFRMIPNGKLYVGIYAQGTYDGAEIQTVQNFAEGTIRQMGVYITHESFTSTHITASQTYATALRTDKKPLQVLLHSDMSSATLSSMTDLTTLTAADVAVILGEDGSYHQNAYSNTLTYLRGDKVTWTSGVYIAKKSTTGNAPFDTDYWSKTQEDLPNILGFSVSTLGNSLGCVSSAKVNESISWPEKFILNSGDTLALAGFSTGNTYISQTTSLLNTLNSQHYIFLRKFIGDSNTYNSDSWTAITETSDYATIENNRTLDKLERNVYAAMVSKISSPIYLNADGTLTEDSIAVFKNIVDAQASQMKTDLELSDYEVTIDPDQDVLTTSTIAVTVQIIPVGIARTIEINDGFTTKIK